MTIVERKCRSVVYTVLAVAGCGESGIVEFTLCALREPRRAVMFGVKSNSLARSQWGVWYGMSGAMGAK